MSEPVSQTWILWNTQTYIRSSVWVLKTHFTDIVRHDLCFVFQLQLVDFS